MRNFMRELYNILYITLILTILIVSIFSVYADDYNSSNNSTGNTTDIIKTNVTNNAVVQPMSLSISVNVTPSSVNFGTLNADGNEHSYTNTDVTVTAIGFSTNLYIKASGDLSSGTNTIPLSNLEYSCADSDPVISETGFTTTNTLIDSYSYFLINSKTYNVYYYLTIPPGTDSGNYNTTITYTAT